MKQITDKHFKIFYPDFESLSGPDYDFSESLIRIRIVIFYCWIWIQIVIFMIKIHNTDVGVINRSYIKF